MASRSSLQSVIGAISRRPCPTLCPRRTAGRWPIAAVRRLIADLGMGRTLLVVLWTIFTPFNSNQSGQKLLNRVGASSM